MLLATGDSTLRIPRFDIKPAKPMTDPTNTGFDPADFLAKAGLGRRIVEVKAKQVFFAQGTPADSVFYLQKGRAKITVVSERGKEATITLITPGEFIGESIAGVVGLRLATATAITGCRALKIDREEMIRVIHEEHAFSDFFLKFLLARSMRTQADLVDQLFNSSEKRLARILLLMAEFGKPGEPETLIPQITQETLADMIGTTRSRVSFFMNRFRKMGLSNITAGSRFTSRCSMSFCTINCPNKTLKGHRSSANRKPSRGIKIGVIVLKSEVPIGLPSSFCVARALTVVVRSMGIAHPPAAKIAATPRRQHYEWNYNGRFVRDVVGGK
jgi:CRP-like cAMP-binding protein